MSILSDNIKKARSETGKTLEDIAKIVGVSRQTIQKYESGIVSNIPSDKIEKLAEAFNTTPAILMGWETENENTDSEFSEDIKIVARGMASLETEDKEMLMNMIDFLSKKGRNAKADENS